MKLIMKNIQHEFSYNFFYVKNDSVEPGRSKENQVEARRTRENQGEPGRTRTRENQVEPGRTKLDSIRFGSIGFDWVRLGSIGFDQVRSGSIGFDQVRLGSIRFDWVRLGSIRFDWVRLGSIRFDWVRSETINFTKNNDENEQKLRDRSMRSKRSKPGSKYKSIKTNQLWKLRIAKNIIRDLKNYGPVGLIHMKAISNIIGRPIQIWRSGGHHVQTINSNQTNENTIYIEYHRNKRKHIGHWTLPGNIDPISVEKHLNGCLFETIASQTGRSSVEFRRITVKYLTDNIQSFTDQIDEFLPSVGKKATPLMIGGARYVGTSPHAAKIILDNSQNALCHECSQYGHPRAHASDKNATGPTDSVENYSRMRGDMRSGFLSREDQDEGAHYALIHRKTQIAMKRLNSGSTNEAVTLTASELEETGCVLSKMKEWYKGEEYTGELDILRVTIVLRHHEGKYFDPNADVFVHTFYPRNN
ncbi:uncharacterized protein LOC143182969 [Calliopsis andreniformis]|uniref:uncharacterized protein LOC143182969 n=1 Tax=Calliopsis andreniformis TaxID=337506 RepID=UPI003FCC92FA